MFITFSNEDNVKVILCSSNHFSAISEKTRLWLAGKALCCTCRTNVNPTAPFCLCKKLKKFTIDKQYEAELDRITSFERRRENRRNVAAYRAERLKNIEGSYNKEDVLEIFDIQEGCCYYCREALTGKNSLPKYHIDHIIPVCDNGTNWPSNLALTCKDCNQKKGARSTSYMWAKIRKIKGKNFVKEVQKKTRKEIAFKKKLTLQKLYLD